MFSFSVTNIFAFSFFAVHYPTGPLNNLFGSVRKMDGHVYFQFHRQSSLFSDRSTPERDVFFLAGDQCTLRSILSTVALKGSNQRRFGSQHLCSGMRLQTHFNNCLREKTNGSSKLGKTSIIFPRVDAIPALLLSDSDGKEKDGDM